MMIGFPGKWPGSAPERAAQCSAWCSSTTMPCASWSTFDAPTRVKAVMDSRIRPSKQYLRSITTTATISAMYFNPRSPCGERRVMPLGCDYFCYFNPRSPCGERPKPTGRRWPHSNFNPRSPCGERHWPAMPGLRDISISIHAPRAGSDGRAVWFSGHSDQISIHAPRAGSDSGALDTVTDWSDFNPRSPCGERPVTLRQAGAAQKFQSTLPVRGATAPGW